MNSVSGVCPNCREEGELATACPEKACRLRGYHRVPHGVIKHDQRLDPEIGLLLDRRYLLVKMLGEGGFGRVFTALQLPLGMEVALKVLKKDQDPDAHENRMRLFKLEAQAMSQLQHPNIVKLIDFGFFEGAAYLVMELVVDARTLKEEIKARAKEHRDLTLPEVEAILTGVLSALEKAHGRKIIHRDVKPENIMLQVEPGHPFLPRLLDFGLAKFVDADTQSSAILGTPAYMAPEQLTKKDPGPWTDLYALGVVAYELMTGRRPFHGAVGEIIADKRNPAFDVLDAISDLSVPNPIAAFLRQALAFEVARRFQSAEEFRKALRAAFKAAEGASGEEFRSIDVSDLAKSTTSELRRPKPPIEPAPLTVVQLLAQSPADASPSGSRAAAGDSPDASSYDTPSAVVRDSVDAGEEETVGITEGEVLLAKPPRRATIVPYKAHSAVFEGPEVARRRSHRWLLPAGLLAAGGLAAVLVSSLGGSPAVVPHVAEDATESPFGALDAADTKPSVVALGDDLPEVRVVDDKPTVAADASDTAVAEPSESEAPADAHRPHDDAPEVKAVDKTPEVKTVDEMPEPRLTEAPPRISGELDEKTVQQYIHRYLSGIKWCYQDRLKSNHTLGGKVTLAFTILPNGSTHEPRVANSSLGDSVLEQCMSTKMERWRFPQPKDGGLVEVAYPLVLKAE